MLLISSFAFILRLPLRDTNCLLSGTATDWTDFTAAPQKSPVMAPSTSTAQWHALLCCILAVLTEESPQKNTSVRESGGRAHLHHGLVQGISKFMFTNAWRQEFFLFHTCLYGPEHHRSLVYISALFTTRRNAIPKLSGSALCQGTNDSFFQSNFSHANVQPERHLSSLYQGVLLNTNTVVWKQSLSISTTRHRQTHVLLSLYKTSKTRQIFFQNCHSQKAIVTPKKGSLFWKAESLVCILWSKRKVLQSCTYSPASATIRAYLAFSEKKKSFLQSL